MRRLPPAGDPEEEPLGTRLTPKALGLVIGLVAGYLLFPGAPREPAAAPPSLPAPVSLR